MEIPPYPPDDSGPIVPDKILSADEYQRLALRTERTPDFVSPDGDESRGYTRNRNEARNLARLLHGMIGVCTEAGELQDMVKKHLIYGKTFDRVNVMEEIGDLTWYCALCLDAVGYTFSEALARNIAKLQKRFPDKFTSEAALNRDLDAERKALEAGNSVAVGGRSTLDASMPPLHVRLYDYAGDLRYVRGNDDPLVKLMTEAARKLQAIYDDKHKPLPSEAQMLNTQGSLVDRIIWHLAQTHDASDLWGHLRRDPDAFRRAVKFAIDEDARRNPTNRPVDPENPHAISPDSYNALLARDAKWLEAARLLDRYCPTTASPIGVLGSIDGLTIAYNKLYEEHETLQQEAATRAAKLTELQERISAFAATFGS